MSSQESLLTLLNQLHAMEKTFVAVLMEAAVKLSSLTESNIFVLVETQEGRKFCGSRHLCDAYAGGEFHPLGTDVELEVDVTASSVTEKHQVPDMSMNLIVHDALPSPENAFCSSFVDRKRKRKCDAKSSVDGGKRKRPSESSSVSLKREIDVVDDPSHHPVEVDDNPGGIFIEDDGLGDDESRCEPDGNFLFGFHPSTSSSAMVSLDAASSSSSGIPPVADVLADVNHLFREKLSTLLGSEPRVAFTYATLEQKILVSLLYDFGKHLAESVDLRRCPDPGAANRFFNASFDRFVDAHFGDYLSRLPTDWRISVNNGKNVLPFRFMKKSCNDSFRSILRRRLKKAFG